MMILTAFVLLSLLLSRMVKAYGWAAVLHPGLWFSIAWMLAFFAYGAIEAVGGVPVHDPFVLDQLMFYVMVTSSAFFVLTFISARKHRRFQVKGDPIAFVKAAFPYKLFAYVGLFGAVVNWVALGANFGYDDSIRQQWLSEIPPVTAAMWYFYFLSFPAAIVSGRLLFSVVLRGESVVRWRSLNLAIPAVAGFFWSLGTGGRQALGILLFHFVVGAAFALGGAVRNGYEMSLRKAIKVFAPAFLVVLFFALFVGLTGLSRAKQQGAAASNFDDIWYLAPVGQLISYTGLTIASHQAYGEPTPRDLTETGPVSLAGFQYFGLRFLTGWRPPTADDTNPERALAASGLELASGTRNVFYDFQADFGFWGGIGVVLVLCVVSHFLFLGSSVLGRGRLLGSSPLAMAIMFWGYSHQFSLLMFNTFYWLVISCLVWDMAILFYRRRR